jgi:uncharacterized protein YndB with AHSA1/START domain
MAANNLIANTQVLINVTIEKVWDALVNPEVINPYCSKRSFNC